MLRKGGSMNNFLHRLCHAWYLAFADSRRLYQLAPVWCEQWQDFPGYLCSI